MAAQKIKGLSTYCDIKNVSINREEAVLNIVLFSNQANTSRVGLRFYLLDEDTKQITLISNNYYWVERFEFIASEANQWEGNIDVNLYKEIQFKLDITNQNRAEFKEQRWVRNLKVLIKADAIYGEVQLTEGETVYTSEPISLVSSLVNVPDIKHIDIKSFDTDSSNKDIEELAIKIYYDYGIESDFNYTNKNIEYHFKIVNPKNLRTINRKVLVENGTNDQSLKLGVLKYTFTNQRLRYPILVNVSIRDVKGKIIKDYTKLFKPVVPKNKVYTKFNGLIKEVTAVYTNFKGDNEPFDDNLYFNTEGFYIKD